MCKEVTEKKWVEIKHSFDAHNVLEYKKKKTE